MLSNRRAYGEWNRNKGVAKTKGFGISWPLNHKGMTKLQPAAKKPEHFQAHKFSFPALLSFLSLLLWVWSVWCFTYRGILNNSRNHVFYVVSLLCRGAQSTVSPPFDSRGLEDVRARGCKECLSLSDRASHVVECRVSSRIFWNYGGRPAQFFILLFIYLFYIIRCCLMMPPTGLHS